MQLKSYIFTFVVLNLFDPVPDITANSDLAIRVIFLDEKVVHLIIVELVLDSL
jgi:hypothetical protein